MKEYYYVSEGIIKRFPELERSEPFRGFLGRKCYIAVIPDFKEVVRFYNEENKEELIFAYECVDSNVTLDYEEEDFDDDDNLKLTPTELTIETCRQYGLLECIDEYLGLSKERNVAYAIYKLSQKYKVTPIEFIKLLK